MILRARWCNLSQFAARYGIPVRSMQRALRNGDFLAWSYGRLRHWRVYDPGSEVHETRVLFDRGNATEYLPLLRPWEVAELARLSNNTVKSFILRGVLPSIKIDGRRYCRLVDVRRLIEQYGKREVLKWAQKRLEQPGPS